jgi:hypothetical protein
MNDRYISACRGEDCDYQLALIINYYKEMEDAVQQLKKISCNACDETFYVMPEYIEHFSKCDYDMITGCTSKCVKK